MSLTLDTLQIRALLRAIDQHQHLRVALENGASEFSAQSILLGADLDNGLLLLGETLPCISPLFKHHQTPRRCWLQVKCGERYLVLEARPQQLEHGLLTVELLGAHWSENRRWHSRLIFADLQGPSAELIREFSANLKGHLRDLSRGGAAIDFWSKAPADTVAKQSPLKVRLSFNSHFDVITEARVIDRQLIRRPSCHTRLRLQFAPLDAVQDAQISYFIDSAQHANVA